MVEAVMAVTDPSNMRWIVPLLMIVSSQVPTNLCQVARETIIVYIDCSNSSVSVGSGNSQCVELDEALSSADSGMVLYLQSGVHTIHNTTTISGLTNISIVGISEVSRDKVVITCSQGQGLSFINVSGLFLSDVTISNCGLSGEPLSSQVDILRKYIELFLYFPPSIQVAVFLGLCENVSIVNTTITNTTGIGLIGINVLGNSVISGMNFINNRYPLTGTIVFRSRVGGGAYFFYGDLHPNVSDTFSMKKSSTLTLAQSRFEFNSDSSSVALVEANYQYILYGSGIAVYPVGGAGGLAIMLAQRNFPSIVRVISTSFTKNSAAFGGGAHVGIFSGIEHSHVSFQDCIFDSNHVDDRYGSSNGGAGLAVFTGLFNPLQSNLAIATENVSVTISGSSFVGNNATKGGGLFTFSLYNGLVSVIASINSDSSSSSPVIRLINCIFMHNTARYGAGLSFEQRIDHGSNGNVGVEINNVTVAENALTGQRSSFANMDSSAMHLEGISVTVSGNLCISDNTATGLYLSAGSLTLSSGATITLSRNYGVLGGGVHLTGRLPIIIAMPNSTLLFRENRAALQGGGIYVTPKQVTTTDVLMPLNDECFFLPLSRETRCPPGNLSCYDLQNLNIYVSFQGNEAPLGGALYGSSLETCLWTTRLRRIRDEVAPGLQILQFLAIWYPDSLDFDQTLDNPSVVSTVPSAISVNVPQAKLMPGQQTRLNVSIMDDYNNEIPAVISSLISSDSDDGSNITSTLGESGYWFADTDTSNATFRITGLENTQVNVTFFTTDTFITKEVMFVLSSCPLGIIYDTSTSRCVCDPRVNTNGVTCDNLTLDINLPNNIWMGTLVSDDLVATDGDVIIHQCGPGCMDGSKMFNSSDFNTQCSKSLGRSGVLCGGCAPSLSATFGSLGCLRCSNYSLFLIPIFILAGILLFVMIALLGFTINKGWINIILFYCNLLSIYGYIISVTYGGTGLFVPAALLSLQIGTNLCFYDGMTALGRTGLQLIFPAYLFALMGVFTLLCRRYSWLSKRFSPTTTLVTLAIMCYVSTLNTIIDILGGITLVTLEGSSSVRWRIDPNQEYSNGYHLFLVHVAVVLLLIYIIPFPIMMLCPSLLYRYLKRFKPFYDALWAPFKRKYRFWLGIRLILLVILFSLPRIFEITFIIPILIIYIMQYLQLILRPFTSSSINYVDNFLLMLLSVVLLGSVYKELFSSTLSSPAILWVEYILLVLIVVAGYVTIAVIFYMQLRIKFSILKRMCHGCCIREPKKTPADTTVVTHSEVGLDDIPSPTRVSLNFEPSSDPAQLRESLLENNF